MNYKRTMIPYTILLIFMIIGCFSSSSKYDRNIQMSQASISGYIFDENNFPIYSASVQLNRYNYEDVIYGSNTDSNGCFQFKNMPYGSHTIIFSALEYSTRHFPIEISKDTSYFLDTIFLSSR